MARCHCSGLLGFVALIALSVSASDSAHAQAGAPITIRYGVQAEHSIMLLPQIIADREGFFAREGIKFEVVPFVSASDLMLNDTNLLNALKKNDIQVTLEAVSFLVSEVQKGSNFVAVASGLANPVMSLVAAKDVRSYSDLKGKTVALTVAHDPITLATQKLMQQHGLKESDVTIKHIGGSGPRFECIKKGECAAASMGVPAAFEAIQEGYHQLGLTNALSPSLFNVEIVERSWAATHKDQVVRYIRALAAAGRFFYDPANREKIVKIAVDITRQPEDRVRKTLAYFSDPKNRVIAKNAEIDVEGFKAAVAMVSEFKSLPGPIPPADRLMDLTYWKAAGIQ